MKKQIINWLLICVAALLTGCADLHNYTEMSDQPPALSAGQGRIYFYRGNELKGAAVNLNDKGIGTLASGCYFYVDKPAGDYFVSCRTGLLDPNQDEHKLTFTLNDGDTKYIRIKEHFGLIVANAQPTFEDKAVAMKTLSSCRYAPQGE